MFVSVVVPVYNVEKFLPRCLQSIMEQTYKKLEIILVDDGSTDNSGAICDEFSLNDDRVIVVHKENGGLSSARNVGTAKATGDYITYLDSDDYWSKDYVEKSLGLCEKYKADISIMEMLYIQESTNEEVKYNREKIIKQMTQEEAIEASLYQILFSCCAPSKMYKAEITKSVEFPEGRLSEDLATCHLFISKATKVVYSNDVGYYYRQRDNSIMHDFNPKRMDALMWTKEIESFCKEHYPDILYAVYCRQFNVAIHLLLDLQPDGDEHDRYAGELKQVIKNTRLKVIVDRKSRKREKIAALLSYFGERALRLIWESRLAARKDK